MSVAKTVEVKVDVSDVDCDECGQRKAEQAFCASCLSDWEDRAGDYAISNYTPPESERRADAAAELRGWLTTERLKPASDITPEVAAIFERCIGDLE